MRRCSSAAGPWHRLWHDRQLSGIWGLPRSPGDPPHPACQSPPQQKAPLRGGGALLGLLQGGEICISIYVDPWEVGGPLMCRGRVIVGIDERHMGGAEPNQEVFRSAPYRSSSANP